MCSLFHVVCFPCDLLMQLGLKLTPYINLGLFQKCFIASCISMLKHLNRQTGKEAKFAKTFAALQMYPTQLPYLIPGRKGHLNVFSARNLWKESADGAECSTTTWTLIEKVYICSKNCFLDLLKKDRSRIFELRMKPRFFAIGNNTLPYRQGNRFRMLKFTQLCKCTPLQECLKWKKKN